MGFPSQAKVRTVIRIPTDTLTEMRRRLESAREAAVAQMRRHMIEARAANDVDAIELTDRASLDVERDVQFRFATRDRKLVHEIDRALHKIASGTYGLCEGTGEPIEIERLKVSPWARFSIEYIEALES